MPRRQLLPGRAGAAALCWGPLRKQLLQLCLSTLTTGSSYDGPEVENEGSGGRTVRVWFSFLGLDHSVVLQQPILG